MTIQVTCTVCQKKYKVKNEYAGRKINCKNCSSQIIIPAAEVEEALEIANFVKKSSSTEKVSLQPGRNSSPPVSASFILINIACVIAAITLLTLVAVLFWVIQTTNTETRKVFTDASEATEAMVETVSMNVKIVEESKQLMEKVNRQLVEKRKQLPNDLKSVQQSLELAKEAQKKTDKINGQVWQEFSLVRELERTLKEVQKSTKTSLSAAESAREMAMYRRDPDIEQSVKERLLVDFRLRQISVAMFEHHSVHRKYPPVSINSQKNEPLLSWRVHLLPFLGQNALYNKFDLAQPWDSEHNKKLIPEMPLVYMSPELKKNEYKTTYVLPVGERNSFRKERQLSSRNMIDGAENTIMVVETTPQDAVTWTRPVDIQYDPENPTAGLNLVYGDRYCFLMGNSAVIYIDSSIPDNFLKTLFTPDSKDNTVSVKEYVLQRNQSP